MHCDSNRTCTRRGTNSPDTNSAKLTQVCPRNFVHGGDVYVEYQGAGTGTCVCEGEEDDDYLIICGGE